MRFDLADLEPVHVGPTNCFVIDTGAGVALIDTGINAERFWADLTAGLTAKGYRLSDVRWVLLTHAHLDHSGLAARLRQETQCQVLINREETHFLRQGGMHGRINRELYIRLFLEHGMPRDLLDWYLHWSALGWARNWRTEPRLFEAAPEHRLRTELFAELHPPEGHDPADQWAGAPMEPDAEFADGDELALGDLRLRVIHTPGHTPGHTSFYHQDSGVLFSGDHVLQRTTPNPGLFFINDDYDRRNHSVPDFLRSLEKLRTLVCRRVFGAHEAAMDNLTHAIDRLIAHHEERAGAALQAVRAGRNTSYGVLPVMFPNLRRNGLFAAMGETIGHMDLLEERGQALPEPRDGLLVYRPAAA